MTSGRDDRATERTSAREPMLDGVRGIAILLVLLRHAWPYPFNGAGVVGVDVFFVLSGFLITGILLRERAATGRVNLVNFYIRRVLRLAPALLVMLTVFVSVSLATQNGDSAKNAMWSAAFALTYTVPIAYPFVPIATAIEPLWTLATEEWFYLVWPFLVVLLLRRRTGLLLPVIGALIVVVSVLRVITFAKFGPAVYTWPGTWADALLGGCFIAALRASGLRLPRLRPVVLLPIAALLLLMAQWPDTRTNPFTFGPGLSLLWVGVAIAILTIAQGGTSPFLAPLASPVLRWFGTRSYGIYLWNAIFLQPAVGHPWPYWLTGVDGIAASLVLAELSWRLVETPALRLKRHFEAVSTFRIARRPGLARRAPLGRRTAES